jgi:Ca2+:H+ antiporter
MISTYSKIGFAGSIRERPWTFGGDVVTQAPPAGPRPSSAVISARIVPAVAVVALVAVWGRELPAVAEVGVVALLACSVLAAVHHAEVVAHRVGEPFGSLILAVAVTVIEVGLIVTLMVSGGDKTDTLARDTVFAAVMITCNGIVGMSLLVTALRHRVAVFNPEGTGAALATVITLATLSLVLPTFTTSTPGPEFTGAQLTFAAVASLTLYGLFVFVQSVRHRDYFLPVARHGRHRADEAAAGEKAREEATAAAAGDHAAAPSTRAAMASLGLLLASLVAVVGLAKVESPTIESAVTAAGLPHSLVGVVIALLVLLPESLAAVRNARRDRVQTSLNLALGSAMASIGLTIPVIAIASIWLEGPLLLGLGATQIVLLALTAAVGILTVMPGRATLLQAAVHLAICTSFLFLAANP